MLHKIWSPAKKDFFVKVRVYGIFQEHVYRKKHSILLYRQLFEVAIQAAIGKRIIARET